MPPPPGPPPSSSSLLMTVIEWLIGITTWKRTAIALVLGSAGLVGYLIFTYPRAAFDVLVVVLRDRQRDTLTYTLTPYRSDVTRGIRRLLTTLSPDMIGIMAWQIDLSTNSMHLIDYAVLDDYKATMKDLEKRWQYPVTVFRDSAKLNDILAHLYQGHFVCTTPEGTWDEVLRRFPVAEICLIPIPPEGIGLSAMLAGGWIRPLTPDDHTRVEMAFRSTAHDLTTR